MSARVRAAVELVLAAAAAVGCVACWLLSQSTVDNAPIADGQPATVSVMFYAPTLALAFILLTLAGVLAVVGIARWRSSAPR